MAAREKDVQALPQGQAEPPRKASRTKRIVIILAILLMTLSGAGIGGYWWLYMRTPSHGSAAPEAPPAGQSGEGAAPATPTGAQGGPPPTGAGAQGAGGGGEARIERQSELPRSGGQVLPLPPITVNLSDVSGRRYLKLGMEVEVNADVSAALQSNSARIRDAVIMLLAGKSYNDVASPDGKVLLKAEVAARLNQILGAQRVVRVYFTDFVVE